MPDVALPLELTELIASSVLSTYTSLPSNGKPKCRSNGAPEWTVLAGFCLFSKRTIGAARWQVDCISVGTGLKVLPHAKLPPHGDVLHDSHAEVIARRGLLLWMYDQLEQAVKGEESWFRRLHDGWAVRDGAMLGMYVSTLPCGDASTYSLSLATPSFLTSPPSAALQSSELLPSSVLAKSLGLQVSRSAVDVGTEVPLVHRGRVSYSSFSSLRTKPGRIDSPPTISHSCSDKLAMWAAVGVQGALLSALGVGLIRIDALVVGGVPADQRTQVATEVERAIGGRLGDWDWQGARSKTPAVAFTDLVFGGARDGIAQAEGIEEAEVVSCPESLSYIASRGTEVLVNGIRQGAGSKRRAGEPLGSKSRSRLSKLAFFERYGSIAESLNLQRHLSSYFDSKRVAIVYRSHKEALQSTAGPLQGWIVSGARWESFGVDGRLTGDSATDESVLTGI